MNKPMDESQLVWAEDRREIKNLMGKYAQCVLLCLWEELETLWSPQEDICLGVNDGFFVGHSEVMRYYDVKRLNITKKAELMQSLFPDKLGSLTKQQLHGVGILEEKAVSTPYIEIAEDRNTAKGLWYSRGSFTDITVKGPMAQWTWGIYAVDFRQENGQWFLWHVQYLEDIHAPVGIDWANPLDRYPDLPAFASIATLQDAKPTVPVTLGSLYTSTRAFCKLPELPRPYVSFSETFSYGYEVKNHD